MCILYILGSFAFACIHCCCITGFSLPKRQDDAGSHTPASTSPQPAPVDQAMPQSQPTDRTSTALTPTVIRHRGRPGGYSDAHVQLEKCD